MDGRREFRIGELAEAAGVPVRTVRYYRERKLLPPPRREGRVGWYSGHHLARLRTISALLERGHTLSGIADLVETFDSGRTVGTLLDLEAATEEKPVRLTPEELADRFAGEVTPENLATAMEMGYLAVDGDEVVHVSRRLLDISSALVREGVPLAAVMAAGAQVRSHADALAGIFGSLLREHVGGERVGELRPLAKGVVEAELSLALDRWLAVRGPD